MRTDFGLISNHLILSTSDFNLTILGIDILKVLPESFLDSLDDIISEFIELHLLALVEDINSNLSLSSDLTLDDLGNDFIDELWVVLLDIIVDESQHRSDNSLN